VGVHRFEDLRVWQAAKQQCDRVGELITRAEFRRDFALSTQLNAASISVMNNISEGFLRHRDTEFLQFLRISAGSNGEVRSCYHAALGRAYLSDVEAKELIELSNSIGRMLSRLQETLRQGPRTDQGPSPNKGLRTKDQGPKCD
jgi:four helix bundle protein